MTTWVLLRGWAREARHWGDFPGALRTQLGEGHAVVAVDLPGNGVRNAERSATSVEAAVESVRRELRRLELRGPFVIVALSLGAMVAMQWACAYPEDVQACVLMNTSARGLAPFWRRLRAGSYRGLLGVLRPGLSPRQREARILALVSNLRADDAEAARQWAAYATQRPITRANALRQLLAAIRFRLPATPPPVPILVLASERDRLVAVDCSRALAARFDLPLRVHPEAGHDLPLDAQDWVIEQVLAWRRSMRLQQGPTALDPAGITITGEKPPLGVRKLVVWPA